MKESVTKFDLESAFKALDEIDIPVSEKGIKANKPALTEIFSRKSKFDALFEEYYDIGSTEELGEAKEEREAEIAKAKLERIEKIVDLDAESPEDLLTSYVGKYIIQCPQCMTLFYKDKEDVVESEEDSSTVNVGEQCQHCGNESGYSLIGKVGEAEPEETEELALDAEVADDTTVEDSAEVAEEESVDEPTEEAGDLDLDLDALDLEEEPAEEEKKEESFVAHTGETLVEEVTDDKELDAKLEAHSEYIEYLRNTITEEEAALEKTNNEQVKAAILRRIDAFKADLEMALPDAVKNDVSVEEVPVEEESVEEPEIKEESYVETTGETLVEGLNEAKKEAELEVSADEFKELLSSPEFKKPISDTAVRAMLNSEKKDEEKTDESVENKEDLEEGIFSKLKDKFADVIDSIASKLKSREAKADWILANARKDAAKVEVDDKGKIVPDDTNRKYQVYVIVGFTDKYKNGKTITLAPSPSKIAELTLGMSKAQTKEDYLSAENLAKGWSMRQGNGPAFIYLADDADDENAVFLCEFFKGKLEHDQLAKRLEEVRQDLKSAQLIAKSGGMEETPTEAEDDEEVVEVVDEALEGTKLNTIIEGLDEIQESSLEKLISDSLVEAYGNVAGYRLTDCEYLNEKFNVNGTIYFTSGKTRNTTYTFSEAYDEEGKVKLNGLNEKLGLDKQFTLAGSIKDKTLITESFKCTKK